MTSTGSAPDIVFRGIDGTEAEEFIAAVQELAFTEGWSQDRERMLLFARSRLRQRALRWFAALDPSEENDWKLFVEALFDQYPPVEAPTSAEISTPIWSATTFSPGASTAILPGDQVLEPESSMRGEGRATESDQRHFILPRSRVYDPSVPGRQVGILRIVAETGTTCPHYVWRGRRPIYSTDRYGCVIPATHDPLSITIDRQEALVVCFIPSSQPHPIGCLNATYKFGDLSLFYTNASDVTCELRTANGVVEVDRDGVYIPQVSKVWNISPDGSLEASLSAYHSSSYNSNSGKYAKEDFKTSDVLVDTSGTAIRFVKPGIIPWQDDPKRNSGIGRYDFKAHIVFEPF